MRIKRKKRKKIWLFVLIPILVLAVAGGSGYFYLQTKLKAGGDSAKSKLANAAIKEMVKHPVETKKMMDSITVTDGDTSKSTANKSENASKETAASSSKAVSSSSSENSSKSQTTYNESSVTSVQYMKSHQDEYELLSTGAENIGGNTYRLTATVKHKPTGKISTVTTTTQLSEDMKNTLKSYRK